jgi:hypothetical protein
VKSWNSTQNTELELGLDEKDVPDGLKVVIFRITQEALNNISKHSKAEWVDLSLRKKIRMSNVETLLLCNSVTLLILSRSLALAIVLPGGYFDDLGAPRLYIKQLSLPNRLGT